MTEDTNDLVRQRREKLESLRALGVDPFGGRFPVTHWARPLADRLRAASEEELKAVERAEARIAMGTYGRSIESGTPIPDDRLEAAPLAELTIEEQRRNEH